MNVLKTINKLNLSEISFLLVLVSLPLSFLTNSISIILFLLVGLQQILVKKGKVKISNIELLYIGLYMLFVSSLFWTDNFYLTQKSLTRFLPYLVLPIAFSFNKNNIKEKNIILSLFSNFLIFIACYCLFFAAVNYFKNQDINSFFYHNLSSNLSSLNAIYLSVMISFSLVLFFNKKNKSKQDNFKLIFLCLFLILLSSKIIILFTFLLLLVHFLYHQKFFRKTSFKLKKTLIVFSTLLFFLFASSNVIKRVKKEYNKTNIEDVISKKEFGDVYLWTGTGLRVFQAKAFFEILKEQKKYFFGLGLNNSQSKLDKKYKEYKLYHGFYDYNFHNQYIQITMELGLIGLLTLLFLFFNLLKNAVYNRDFFQFYFTLLIITVCITESYLWRQRGMVFFIAISLLIFKTNQKNNC